MAKNDAENIFEDLEPRVVTADELHSMMSQIAALQEENNSLRTKKGVDNREEAPNLLGGDPVTHHLHLTDGRVITNHGGIGTHYSETLPDGTEQITRIREYYPAFEVHPSLAYA